MNVLARSAREDDGSIAFIALILFIPLVYNAVMS